MVIIKTTYTNSKRLKQNKPKALKSSDEPNHSFVIETNNIHTNKLKRLTCHHRIKKRHASNFSK
jgi:hypothetical protein